MAGLDGTNLLMWRWLCATGVYHAAANTLSVDILHEIGRSEQSVEEYLCKHQHVWSENKRYFDRCAAGLGMIDAEHRLEKVMSGDCKRSGGTPDEWELFQLHQFGPTLQLSCNPASTVTGFTVVMGGCPEAFRMHFPCILGDPDHAICTGEQFGMDVKKDGNIVPYHRLCGGHDMLRRMFECTNPAPHKAGTNMQLVAQEWSNDHPGEPKPWNVIDWFMGTNVGVWGGWCTCPDGRVYQVGDEGNMCESVACDGGFQGACPGGETEGAFRKVICEPQAERPASAALNVVIEDDRSVGVWGGTCRCPDGEIYLTGALDSPPAALFLSLTNRYLFVLTSGDENNECGSLACEGGVPGQCNHYVSLWAGVRVRCNLDLLSPSTPPIPPISPPSPAPPPPPPPPPSISPQSPPQTPPSPSSPPPPLPPTPLPPLSTASSRTAMQATTANRGSDLHRAAFEDGAASNADILFFLLSTAPIVALAYLAHRRGWLPNGLRIGQIGEEAMSNVKQSVKKQTKKRAKCPSVKRGALRKGATRVANQESDEDASNEDEDVYESKASLSANGSKTPLESSADTVAVEIKAPIVSEDGATSNFKLDKAYTSAVLLVCVGAICVTATVFAAAASLRVQSTDAARDVAASRQGHSTRVHHGLPTATAAPRLTPRSPEAPLKQPPTPLAQLQPPPPPPSPLPPPPPPSPHPPPPPPLPTLLPSPLPSSPPLTPPVPAPLLHPEPQGEWYSLRSASCAAMLHDRTHKFHQLWGKFAWINRNPGDETCWSYDSDFFDNALRPEQCNVNWLEGAFGGEHDRPPFTADAAPVLGFDGTIWEYCSEVHPQGGWGGGDWNRELARRCVEANLNILRIMFSCPDCIGSRAGWNMCRNLQWVMVS